MAHAAENVVEIVEALSQDMRTLFEQYRRGELQLCVWRNSSPHNWWLSTPGDRDDIVYHWKEGARPERAFLELSLPVHKTVERVGYRGRFKGRDEGSACGETWMFDHHQYAPLFAEGLDARSPA